MSLPEQWRPIPDYEGYEASSLGRIRSRWIRGGAHNRGRRLGSEWRILAGWTSFYGYRQVTLVRGDANRTCAVHILVAETFHGPRPAGNEVRHLNGTKLDNRGDNLRWGTKSENGFDKVRHGTHQNARKTHCKRDHLYDEANTYILPGSGSRVCRACTRDRHERRMLAAANVPAAAAA